MKFSYDTEVEDLDLTLSQTATYLWLKSAEADKDASQGAKAQCLRDSIKHAIDSAAGAIAGNTSGAYRVVWGREQVLVLLPKPKAVAA